MDVALWVGVAVGILTILGMFGRGLRSLWRILTFIRDLMEEVHDRSAELTKGGGSMRDRVEAIYRWRQGVDSTLADHAKRLDAVEKRRRR